MANVPAEGGEGRSFGAPTRYTASLEEKGEDKQQYEPVIDVAAQPHIKLHTGQLMPTIGLGTADFGAGKEKVVESVRVALQSGYRHIDTAWIYFTEPCVAQGIVESGVPREEIFLTTKLFNTFHREHEVEPYCRESLQNLNTSYIDLYLIHWPISMRIDQTEDGYVLNEDGQLNVPIEETWRAMEALVEKGLVRAIGLSNYKISTIKHILSFAKIRPAVLQVEGHVYLQQRELKAFCDQEGIVLTAYASLGIYAGPRGKEPMMMEDPTILEIANSLGRPPADVLYRWTVQAGFSVLPKSITPSRVRSNLQACLNPMPESAMEKISKITIENRYLPGDIQFPASRRFTGDVPYPNPRSFWEDTVHYEPAIDVDAQPRQKLNTGAMMPTVQFGTTTGQTDTKLVEDAVWVALQSGYRAINSAWSDRVDYYIGYAIRWSNVPRSEIFITSKLGNIFHEADQVEKGVRETLEWLWSEYLDLCLIDWPISISASDASVKCLKETGFPSEDSQINVPIEETWRAMEALVEKGLVKAIGLSNFKLSTIRHILSFAKIRPAVLQVEAHVWLQQRELKKFCDDEGIVMVADSPAAAVPQVLDDPTVTEVAGSLGHNPADVLARWPVQAGFATSRTSLEPEKIRSNLQAALNPLPDSAMEKLGGITTEHRYEMGDAVFPKSGNWVGENLPYSTKKSLWED